MSTLEILSLATLATTLGGCILFFSKNTKAIAEKQDATKARQDYEAQCNWVKGARKVVLQEIRKFSQAYTQKYPCTFKKGDKVISDPYCRPLGNWTFLDRQFFPESQVYTISTDPVLHTDWLLDQLETALTSQPNYFTQGDSDAAVAAAAQRYLATLSDRYTYYEFSVEGTPVKYLLAAPLFVAAGTTEAERLLKRTQLKQERAIINQQLEANALALEKLGQSYA